MYSAKGFLGFMMRRGRRTLRFILEIAEYISYVKDNDGEVVNDQLMNSMVMELKAADLWGYSC